MKQARLLLADDHAVVAEGFRSLIEGEFNVVGIAPDGRTLLDLAEQHQPDVVLLDIGMPLLNGIDAAVELKRKHPQLKNLFLTMHADRAYVKAAFRAGASAYLLKQSDPAEVAFAIREVLKGHVYVTPMVAAEVITPWIAHGDKEGPHPAREVLTRRQRQVLQLVAEGHTTKEIAKLPAKERRPNTCARERVAIHVQLSINGEQIHDAMLPPTGLSRDGPARIYEKFLVPAGRHVITARLRDSRRAEGFDYESTHEVDLAAWQNLAIDFKADKGGFEFR